MAIIDSIEEGIRRTAAPYVIIEDRRKAIHYALDMAVAGDVIRGPSVTRYEFMLEQGVKLSKVTNLQDDIALALGATGVRIAPIPDKISVIGIEVAGKGHETYQEINGEKHHFDDLEIVEEYLREGTDGLGT